MDPVNLNFTLTLAECIYKFNRVYYLAGEKVETYKNKV